MSSGDIFITRAFLNIFVGEMLIRTQPETIFQTFRKVIFSSKVIYESFTDLDDTCLGPKGLRDHVLNWRNFKYLGFKGLRDHVLN